MKRLTRLIVWALVVVMVLGNAAFAEAPEDAISNVLTLDLTVQGVDTATVTDLNGLNDALANENISTIIVDGEITSETIIDIGRTVTLKAGTNGKITGDIVINANDVTIDGLTIISGSKNAPVVRINDRTGITLSNNIIDGQDGTEQNAKQGVWINRAEVTLTGNTVQNNLQNGIWVDAGKTLTITDNIVKNNLTGMNFNSSLEGATNIIIITGNTFIENNKHGISIGGSAGVVDDNFTIESNKFENNLVSQFSDRRYTSETDTNVSPGKADITANNTFIPTKHYWEWDAEDVRWLLK